MNTFAGSRPTSNILIRCAFGWLLEDLGATVSLLVCFDALPTLPILQFPRVVIDLLASKHYWDRFSTNVRRFKVTLFDGGTVPLSVQEHSTESTPRQQNLQTSVDIEHQSYT